MTPEGRISGELRPFVDSSEAVSVDRVGAHLLEQRPEPSLRFRAELHARLTALINTGAMGPKRLRLSVAAYVGTGTLLLGVAAWAGLSGSGL